jgi:hypothetical protein
VSWRFAAAIFFASMAFGQNAREAEIALAAKSPNALARDVESHRTIDWKALRTALGLTESKNWQAPCGVDSPVVDAPCSVDAVTVSQPDQAILIIRGREFSWAAEYLHYWKTSGDGWRFSGEKSVGERNAPSEHRLMQIGDKPFFVISGDYSQIGFAIHQVLEDWFDLTQKSFEPVFSVTVDGSHWRFAFGVGRTIHADYVVSQTAGLERIGLTLSTHFDGVGLDQEAKYFGVYERRPGEKTFKLRGAYSGADRRRMSISDFAELADPFSGLPNETLLAYALPGLQKIATGSDRDAREWLRLILSNATDTPEKRTLLELMARR